MEKTNYNDKQGTTFTTALYSLLLLIVAASVLLIPFMLSLLV